MKDGFFKIASAVPAIKVADTEHNADAVIDLIKKAAKCGARLVLFPELCLTGSTCGDLFLQKTLIDGAENALLKIAKRTEKLDIISVVGLPVMKNGVLYNAAAVIKGGEIFFTYQADVPTDKKRYFANADESDGFAVSVSGGAVPNITFAVKIGDDSLADSPYASVILNMSAENETVSSERRRETAISARSAELCCAYVYAGAGEGESTTDLVFAGQRIIAECGSIISKSELFETGLTVNDIDLAAIEHIRRKNKLPTDSEMLYTFDMECVETQLERKYPRLPFVPEDKAELELRCKKVLRMQCEGLKKRMTHINADKIVIGISGGLDSTLAVIAAVETMKLLKKPVSDIITVTMPCFGTTKRTRSNAEIICGELGTTFKEVSIKESVTRHFKDIGHDMKNVNAAFENAQARERTQVLMDIANDVNGIVVGTGDLSELALGWATYSGDHMSMYAVNGSITKTLIRKIVAYYADNSKNKTLKAALNDIIDTPVSPELLPAKNGSISQKTEDLVGPYELHDFFLYHFIREGCTPTKLFRLAVYTFEGEYDAKTIMKWLKNFVRRFFSQQFKRSCIPDGIKVGSVSLSPRGDYVMPSDAVSSLWLSELEKIKICD